MASVDVLRRHDLVPTWYLSVEVVLATSAWPKCPLCMICVSGFVAFEWASRHCSMPMPHDPNPCYSWCNLAPKS
jgi:hypothetical protein